MDEADRQELNELANIRRELATIRQLVAEAVNYIIRAEAEIPEHMRRFANYCHDLHSMKYMYEEQGTSAPPHLMREMERVDDRYRQLLAELHSPGGVFEKVRREMAADPLNRYDHTRLLPGQEVQDETGKSNERLNGGP